MAEMLNDLIVQLEIYSQNALTPAESSIDQSAYWRGVRFGVELALLEIVLHCNPIQPLPMPFISK